MDGNTIFITGGGSGIGRGLAEAFHKRGNQVLITGRREGRLRGICDANPGMRYYVMDVTNPVSIRETAVLAIKEFPALNCVFSNAGVQSHHNLSQEPELDDAKVVAQIDTNLLGVIRVAAAFLPHLVNQRNAVLVNVSSGLAFVPLTRFPVYCATKAAVHSFTMSLRHQMKESGVHVRELIPPWVETDLGGTDPLPAIAGGMRPMPLADFITETMRELAGDSDEMAIAGAKDLMAAANGEVLKRAFAGMNR
jgi:uncharacterized oxidoreductase